MSGQGSVELHAAARLPLHLAHPRILCFTTAKQRQLQVQLLQARYISGRMSATQKLVSRQ
jgi:hypothetical protein